MGCRRGDRPRTRSTGCGRSKPQPRRRRAASSVASRRSRPPKGTAGERALALAGQAATLEDLRAALAGFDGCALRDTASNLVFAEGDPASTTLIIGEPPGREEDRSGHPFAGPEGQLLDQMLASIGLTRDATDADAVAAVAPARRAAANRRRKSRSACRSCIG